jgi:sugar phosphate isomerase/epimerase
MEISLNIGYLRKRRCGAPHRTLAECAKITKDAGFNSVDYSANSYIENENWIDEANASRDVLSKAGLTVHQMHAPYVFDKYNEDDYKEYMRRSFEACTVMGTEYMVIHADKYVPGPDGYDFNKALNTIYDFYAPYVDYAKKHGFGVAIENLFEPEWQKERNRFTSKIEEQIAIIEKFNDPIVTACWDTGHGKVANGDKHIEEIAKLGSLVTCTHIHDNIYGIDQHSPVYLGDCDWEGVVKHLRNINYKGHFTLELVYGTLPDELLPRYMKLYYDTCEYLLNSVK